MSEPHARLDARGLKCPLPVLKARRALQPLAPGEVLELLADDPAAPKDFQGFAATTGHRLETFPEGGGWRFRITKTG